jgi:hypothetical protein
MRREAAFVAALEATTAYELEAGSSRFSRTAACSRASQPPPDTGRHPGEDLRSTSCGDLRPCIRGAYTPP